MPCNDGGGYDWRSDTSEIAGLKQRNDVLAAENCLLRETIIKLITAPPGSPVEIDRKVMKMIDKSQRDHRKEDLARLEKTFREAIELDQPIARRDGRNWFELLGRVLTADPSKPLEPQLGFDPNSY